MSQRRLGVFATSSFALCVALCAMCVRSFYVADHHERVKWNLYDVTSARGSIDFRRISCDSALCKRVVWKQDDPRLHEWPELAADMGPGIYDLVPLQPLQPKTIGRVDLRRFPLNGTPLSIRWPNQRPFSWFRWTLSFMDTDTAGYMDRVYVRELIVPYWVLAMCLLLIPGEWLRRRFR